MIRPAPCHSNLMLLATLIIFSCKNDPKHINSLSSKKILQEETLQVESFYSQSGNMKAVLKSPLMLRKQADTPYIEFPKTIHVDFLNDSTLKKEIWLDSKYAKYYENQNKVLLRDSVKVLTIHGDTLTTSELWWDQQKGSFYTTKVALYKGKNNLKMKGQHGMEATQDLKTVTFLKPIGTMGYQQP